jgi:hypothetical protein
LGEILQHAEAGRQGACDEKAPLVKRPVLTDADVDYLRSICPAAEFEHRCRVAVGLVAHHREMDRQRGQTTGRAARIARSQLEFAALNLLLSRRWADDDDDRTLRRLRQDVFVELEQARKSPKRGAKNALDVAAVLVVTAFGESGLTVDARKNGAISVLALICRRAGMQLSAASYKAAILRAKG